MCGVRASVRIHGIVGIAVVSGEKDGVSVLDGGVDNLLHAAVNAFNRLADSVIYACVADHVTVCEVQDDEILLLGVDGLHELLGNFRSAHLRLEVVCCNFRRVHQNPVLVLERSLAAAVEEECHVCVFLGLGNAELTLACLGNHLAEGVLHEFLVEEDVESGK